MNNMYEKIQALCLQKGIKPGRICTDTGLSRGMLTDLKMGRTKTLSAKNTQIIADYLGVSVDYLLGREEIKNAPTESGARTVSDDDIKFALFGGDGEITDAMYDEVRNFAAYVKQREANRKKE